MVALAPCLPLPAAASCGAAFCSVNTSWDVHGAWLEPSVRLDLRYEYIRQDQPMSGRNKVGVGQMPRHHDESLTRNENWIAGIDYALNQDWGLNATLPLVKRDHDHIHNHGGARLFDSWHFTGLGDARVLVRRRLFTHEDQMPSVGTLGANFGLKLPTGRIGVRNQNGERAERTLQPGTGTTDLLAGLYYSSFLPMRNLSWFVQGMAQIPLRPHEDFRPGNRFTADTGMRYAVSDPLSVMLQANLVHRRRDAGAQAEPEDTGGTALFLSPGASYAFSREVQVYGFLQLPVYQYVNGVQLTPRHALVAGISLRF
jgi:hypothetical protein